MFKTGSNLIRGLCHTVWPDLAKFLHFGEISKVFGNFLSAYLVFLNLIEQIFIVVKGQILTIGGSITVWLTSCLTGFN